MKLLLTLVFCFICLILFFSPNAFADWREALTITEETQEEHGIYIKVSSDKEYPDKYLIEINKFKDKCCWMLPNGEKTNGFGEIITASGNTTQASPLKFNKTGEAAYYLDKALINKAYILFDYCQFVFDGGYYYLVDLSTYKENLS